MSCSSDRRSSCAIDNGSAGRAFGVLESRLYSLELTNPREPRQVYNQTAIKCIFRRVWYKIRTRVAYNHTDVFPVQNRVESKNGVGFMQCTLCQSLNFAEFSAEMMIHFSGLRNIDHPGVPAFPKVLVCLNCGSSHFTVPATNLALLESRTVPLAGRVESPAVRVA